MDDDDWPWWHGSIQHRLNPRPKYPKISNWPSTMVRLIAQVHFDALNLKNTILNIKKHQQTDHEHSVKHDHNDQMGKNHHKCSSA